MTAPRATSNALDAVLRRFGWDAGDEFQARYVQDPWVFNLANALERLAGEVVALTTERDEIETRLQEDLYEARLAANTEQARAEAAERDVQNCRAELRVLTDMLADDPSEGSLLARWAIVYTERDAVKAVLARVEALCEVADALAESERPALAALTTAEVRGMLREGP